MLLLFAIIIVSVSWYYIVQDGYRQIEEENISHAKLSLNKTQGYLEYAFRNNNLEAVQREISSQSIEKNCKLALIVDEGKSVIYASQMKLSRQPLRLVLKDKEAFGFYLDNSKIISKSHAGTVQLSKKRDQVFALYPLLISGPAGGLRPTSMSLLFVRYDISGQKEMMFQHLREHILLVSVFIFVMVFFLWLYFNRVINRRVEIIIETAESASNRGSELLSKLDGNDELKRISDALDNLIQQRNAGEEKILNRERDFKSYIDSSPMGIFIANKDAKFIRVNDSACDMIGYPREELLKLGIEDIKVTYGDEEKLHTFGKLGSEGKLRFESDYKTKDGDIRTWLLSAVKLSEDKFLSFTVDITERKEMESQLRQSEKMQAIGELAGGVAHDFNNQLAGILNFANLSKDEVDENSEVAEFIDYIISGVNHSADLTKKLLAFARKGKYVVTNVDTHKILSEVVSILTHSINKNIEIIQHLDASSYTVSGDVSQLQNAILNICLNSRDAMSNGGELVLSTDTFSIDDAYIKEKNYDIKAGEYIRIFIADTGIGMRPEIKRRVFEPFFTTKGVGEGTGMGMASVYGTIQNHGGAISVDSQEGQGTKIEIILPTVEAPMIKEKETVVDVGSKNRHIMVVDDEELLLKSLKILFDRNGYKATCCSNGKEALRIFKDSWEDIDLVILDMIMPELDGKAVYYAMKQINPDVEVLLLSGFSLTAEAKELIKDGAMGFMQKPVKPQDLLNEVAELL